MRGVLVAIALAWFVAASPSSASAAAGPDHAVVAASSVPTVFALQANPPKDANVDINLNRNGGGRWYGSPLWIGIGALAVIVILLIVVLAARGSGTTTIVRE